MESDTREVMETMATPEEPLVILIDDLDRCAPRRVAEIIEASRGNGRSPGAGVARRAGEAFIVEKGFDFVDGVRDVNFFNFRPSSAPLGRYTEAGLW